MDPASAFTGVVRRVNTLVSLSNQTTTFLSTVYRAYTDLQLAIWDLLASCKGLQTEWENVHIWLEGMESRPNSINPRDLEHLAWYEFMSEGLLMSLQKDLDSLFPGWRKSVRLRATQRPLKLASNVFRLQNKIRDHCQRINHLTTSLRFLRSTIQLLPASLQDAVLDTVELRFRKDEETAWTIVQTRRSTVASRPSSIASLTPRISPRPSSILLTSMDQPGLAGTSQVLDVLYERSDLQRDLMASPVYKRRLYAILRDISISPPPHVNVVADNLDAVLIGAKGIMRDSGKFSVSCYENLEALRLARQESKVMQPRYLPLANALCRQEFDEDEQRDIDQRFLLAVKNSDPEGVAAALDGGADINAQLTDHATGLSQVALSLCLGKPRDMDFWKETRRDIMDHLLLYEETQLDKFEHSNGTLLHACMLLGCAAILQRIPLEADLLSVADCLGYSPLHVAVLAGDRSLSCVDRLSIISTERGFKLSGIVDSHGRTPLDLALEAGMDSQALLLAKYGAKANPQTQPGSLLGETILEASRKAGYRIGIGVSPEDLLLLAVERGRARVVEQLLRRGAQWEVEKLNADDVVERVNNTQILLHVLKRRSVPQKKLIDVTHLIYGHIWTCDRRMIEGALRGDNQNVTHECLSIIGRTKAFVVYSRQKLVPFESSDRRIGCCIHVAMRQVLTVLDEFPHNRPRTKRPSPLVLFTATVNFTATVEKYSFKRQRGQLSRIPSHNRPEFSACGFYYGLQRRNDRTNQKRATFRVF